MRKTDRDKEDVSGEVSKIATAAGLADSANLHGKANSEFITAYTGVDNELGKALERSHQKISEYRVSPEFAENNIRQQAGFSAEITHTARGNAERILSGSSERVVRTEDAGFGSNHEVFDHVRTMDGAVVEGSGSQMKFVSNLDSQLKKIAEGKGGGKNDHSRYMSGKLTLPSDQVEQAKEICSQKASSLHTQARAVEADGNQKLAKDLRQRAQNYEELRDSKIEPANLTTEEAIEYRTSPKWSTAKDIGRVSHKAGVQGAQLGAALGGGISLLTNMLEVAAERKTPGDAIKDVAVATGKSAATGYFIGFGGSALSGTLRQSSSSTVRTFSSSNLPTMILSTCMQLSSSVKALVQGEISNTEFFEQVGQSGTNMLASSMFAAAGQVAIPVPVIGAIAGSLVGYALSSVFYQETLTSFKAAQQSEARYKEMQAFCDSTKRRMEAETLFVKRFFETELDEKSGAAEKLFKNLDSHSTRNDVNGFIPCINEFCELAGYQSSIRAKADLDDLISSGKTLKI